MKIEAPGIEAREDFSVAAKNRKKNSSSVNQAAKASKSDMSPAVQEEQAAAEQAASAAAAQGTVAAVAAHGTVAAGADDSADTGAGAVAEATVSVSARPVAVLSDKNGQAKAMNVAEFGQHVLDNYSVLQSGWSAEFRKYHQTHNMEEVLAKLKEGMDGISCAYVDRHMMLCELAAGGSSVLVKNDLTWTDADRALLNHYQKLYDSGTVPFLNNVNLEWGSSVTNMYGMYDLPGEVINRVKGKNIIDGGGFIGDTITVFRHFFSESHVISFEPVGANFKELTTTFEDDIKAGHVEAINKGLGAEPGSLRVSKIQGERDSMATLTRDFQVDELYEQIEVITLDSFVKERNLEAGLIKLDVEGYEEPILEGARQTIIEQKPLLVIACYHNPNEFYELKGWLESLNLGYRFRLRRSCFGNPLNELVLIAWQE